MAHADYDCCAICDSKMEYSGMDSKTKEKICTECLKKLRSNGLMILDTVELIAWMKTSVNNPKELLDAIGFKKCADSNEVDDAYEKLSQ